MGRWQEGKKEGGRQRREGERGKHLWLEERETALVAKPEEVLPIPPACLTSKGPRHQERPRGPGAALGSPQSLATALGSGVAPVLMSPLNRARLRPPFQARAGDGPKGQKVRLEAGEQTEALELREECGSGLKERAQ